MTFRAPYIERFLARQERALARGHAVERWLHLGHWDQGHDEDDIEAAQRRLEAILLELAELEDGQRVLDVGCGVGGTLGTLGARCPSSALVGLNVDPRQLEVAARLTPPPPQGSLSLVAADATNIPFRDGTFDRVLAIECAFHFPSRARFVAEAARVASPGGLLVMSDIVPADSLRAKRDDSYWQELRLTLEAGLGPWPDFFGDEPPLEALLPEHGLAIEVLRDATARTLPSFASFTRAPSAELQPLLRALSVDDAEASRIDPAVGLLGRLLREGFLRVVYVAARRTARARSV